MQTPSHFLITAFAERQFKARLPIPIATSALLAGSVLPDLPFTLLTLLGESWFIWFRPLPGQGTDATVYEIMIYLHFDRLFQDPLWIVSHNFFHSLVIDGMLVAVGWWLYKRKHQMGLSIFWLALGALTHTLIDILTHSSDGPLFLFPLNWTYRFQSPVSYWETANYGWAFALFEYTLDVLLLSYFGWLWRQHRYTKRAQ